MKLLKTLILICSVGVICALGQKDKDDKKGQDEGPVEIRTNLMVVDASQASVDEIKIGDIRLYDNDVEQKITYFARKPTTNIAFVMDNTGSMRPQLAVEIALGKVLATSLRSGEEAMVVRFVGRDNIKIWQPWTTDRTKLSAAFDNLYIEGGQSAITDGLYLTAETMLERAKSEEDKRFAIVIISDGEDRDSYYTTKQLYSLLEGSGIEIFAVGLDKDLSSDDSFIRGKSKITAPGFLKELTVRSGGDLFLFEKKYQRSDLQSAVNSLTTELRSQYVIGYMSSDRKAPGKLRAEIADGPKGEKRTGTVKGGFVGKNK